MKHAVSPNLSLLLLLAAMLAVSSVDSRRLEDSPGVPYHPHGNNNFPDKWTPFSRLSSVGLKQD